MLRSVLLILNFAAVDNSARYTSEACSKVHHIIVVIRKQTILKQRYFGMAKYRLKIT